MADDLHHALEHLGIAEIEIDLIVAERAPDPPRTAASLDLAQQRRSPRPHHAREIVTLCGGGKIVAPGLPVVDKVLEPATLAGTVIDDQVGHEIVLGAYTQYVIPVAQGRVDVQVIDHRKTVIGTRRIEGQDVHPGEQTVGVLVQPVLERAQGPLALTHDAVAVSDHQGIALIPVIAVGLGLGQIVLQTHAVEQLFSEAPHRRVDAAPGVENGQMLGDAMHQIGNRDGSARVRISLGHTPQCPLLRPPPASLECSARRCSPATSSE